MPDNTQLILLLDRWISTIDRCLSTPMSMPACKPFWQYVLYGSAALVLALLLWTVWKLISYLLQVFVARRAQRERARVADQATMRQYVWDDDKYITDEVTDPKLAEKIPKELEQRRLHNIESGSRRSGSLTPRRS
jgi:hypothetical protein